MRPRRIAHQWTLFLDAASASMETAMPEPPSAACSCPAMSSTTTEPLATTIEEPLARLVAFEPTTFPVLSVYLNTQPDQHGRTPDAAPYLHREFKALARTWAPSSPEHHSFDQDVERSFPI
jgi:hypothetical protein